MSQAQEAATEKIPSGEKEKNYISAVVYLGEEEGFAAPFLEALTERLAARFENYELILVEDGPLDGTEEEVRRFLKTEDKQPVTIIHMSLRQGLEAAMNAGIDMAVGDFVYTFDSMKMPYSPDLIDAAYDTCLQGNDIVSVSPTKNRGVASSLFYKLFNSSSRSKYKLRTDVFQLLSRRAINRVNSLSPHIPYRKAAYAASGLKLATLVYDGAPAGKTEQLRMSRATDSLALYTNIAYKVSFAISMVMLALMLAAVVYTIVVFAGIFTSPVPGWTTTMLVLTGGFFGVFLILSFILKYLSLIVELVFTKQKYLIESVEKIP